MVGYSDADVLLHALTDALLGAAALGDIGEMFPDTDLANRGRDSAEMLRVACDAVEAAGWRVANVDCIVFAERPKLGPYKTEIRRRLAEILNVDPSQVAVKAKTGEGVGEVGREEVIAAQCVALLEAKEGSGFKVRGSETRSHADPGVPNPEPRTLNPKEAAIEP